MRELIAQAVATAVVVNIAEAVNAGREAGFEDIADQIGAYQWSAILDDKTCERCTELDGKNFKPSDPQLDALRPPLHPNCRCILVAILKEELVAFPVAFANFSDKQVFDLTLNKLW